MIRQAENPKVLPGIKEILVHRREDLRVDLLDCRCLFKRIALMAAFVRCLYVDVYQISPAPEGIDRRLSLAKIVRVIVARRTRYRDHLAARTDADSLDQIHGTHDRRVQMPLVLERRQRGLSTRTPEPRRVGGILALCPSALVHRMMVEYRKTLFHEFQKCRPAIRSLWQIRADLLAEMVMRSDEIVRRIRTAPDHAVAIAHSRVEMAALQRQRVVQCLDQLVRLLRGDLPGTVVEDHALAKRYVAFGQRHHIAADRGVVRLHGQSETHRFEWRTPLGIELRIVGQDREIGRIAFGNHADRDVQNRTAARFCSQRVHKGLVCRLHRGFAGERGIRTIRHPVGNENEIFHIYRLLSVKLGGSDFRLLCTEKPYA